ncbi:GDSL-type esterase/lipase family protein [Polaribacter sp.]|uniref:GDSL-type esterase/lipase family protein n=1 Tax=Polaribacter sp. TaxID=1920175 RepID=UPI003F6B7503
MKKLLSYSILLNILFLLLFGYFFFIKRDGLNYIKNKIFHPLQAPLNSHLYQTKLSIFNNMPTIEESIIFLGDSITAFCNWSELFKQDKIINRGISGDTLDGVLYRIDEIIKRKPKKIFLMIGINDLGKGYNAVQILEKYDTLINKLNVSLPKTKIYIQSILPAKRKNLNNTEIKNINIGLQNISKKYNSNYIDLHSSFLSKNNELDDLYSLDGLHLNGEGYHLWKNSIEEYLE